jgi:hypothetical protein
MLASLCTRSLRTQHPVRASSSLWAFLSALFSLQEYASRRSVAQKSFSHSTRHSRLLARRATQSAHHCLLEQLQPRDDAHGVRFVG